MKSKIYCAVFTRYFTKSLVCLLFVPNVVVILQLHKYHGIDII